MKKRKISAFLLAALLLVVGMNISPLSVKATTIISELHFTFDYSAVALDTSLTEGEVDDTIINTYGVTDKGVIPDDDNSGLDYYNGTEVYGIGNGSNKISADRVYLVEYYVELEDGYDWLDKSGNFSGMTAYINGVKTTPADILYNEYWNGYSLCFELGTPAEYSSRNTVAATTITGVTNTTKGLTLTWEKNDTVTKYRIYRKSSTNSSWQSIKYVSASATSYTDTTVEAGVLYRYLIKPINGSVAGPYTTSELTIRLLAPENLTITNGASGAVIKWDACAGATKYAVYRRAAGENWSVIKTVTGTTYTDTTAASGVKYVYSVKAVRSNIYSTAATYTYNVFLNKPSTLTVTNSAAGTVTAKWSKDTTAGGYYVIIKNAKTGAQRSCFINNNTTLTKVITGLTKGQTYKIAIKNYKTVGGVRYASAFSTIQTITLTK